LSVKEGFELSMDKIVSSGRSLERAGVADALKANPELPTAPTALTTIVEISSSFGTNLKRKKASIIQIVSNGNTC
jgi:hypothetical protein